jgi:hypothetical protein
MKFKKGDMVRLDVKPNPSHTDRQRGVVLDIKPPRLYFIEWSSFIIPAQAGEIYAYTWQQWHPEEGLLLKVSETTNEV